MDSLYVLGRIDWRDVSYHGESWDRPAYRAAIVGGARAEAIGDGVAFERLRGSVSVCAVSDCGHHALGLLPSAIERVWEAGPDLSDIYCDPHAAWNFRPADCGNSGGGDVELERGAEFVVVERDHGFLRAAAAGGQ